MDLKTVLKALADETRLNILTLLLRHSYCVRALAKELQLTEATISQHLRVLRDAGLLTGEKRGYYMHHVVERSVLLELSGVIAAMAASDQEACRPEQRDDCPAVTEHACSENGKCSDEVRKFCHGTDPGRGE
ncbi:MAG: metalloregulator ArsR/SmtB family transcription factor [Bacillota bacterium]|nr:metalloregulator ArsR/SmtB family transcription factor [Bacillota bacterium]